MAEAGGGGGGPSAFCLKRLTNDYRKYGKLLAEDPDFAATARAPFYAVPDPADLCTCWVVLRGTAGTDWEGGLFLGRIRFPAAFPAAPPTLIMVTPNGRVHLEQRFCTTFSDFHPDTWSPTWNVITLCKGLVSFLFDGTNELDGTYGKVHATPAERRQLAAASHAFNARHPVYQALFAGHVVV